MSRDGLTRIAVVSDDRLLCDGLVQFLSEQPDFLVCGRCPGSEFPPGRLAREHDIILADARDEDVWSSARAIPNAAAVILVGASEDDAWATAVLTAGARGILTRSAGRDDLVNAIRVVRGGGIWARRRWLNACVLHIVGASQAGAAARDTIDTRLSRREREVMQHAATGVGNKELADRLSISEATVKVHLTHIFQKLGVPGRAALAAAYHQIGTMGRTADLESRTTNDVVR